MRSKKRTKSSRSWARKAPSVAVSARPSIRNQVRARSGGLIVDQSVAASQSTEVRTTRKRLIPSTPSS
jgi:hypothetical protein